MRILVSGGGTGGHVYPILAVNEAFPHSGKRHLARSQENAIGPAAQGTAAPHSGGQQSGADSALDQDTPIVELHYVGEAGGIEEGLTARAGIPFSAVTSGQIRGRSPLVAGRNLLRMVAGARQCVRIMRDFQPDVAFITGGYVTAPVALAAWRYRGPGGRRCPLLIYLPDLTPGLAVMQTSRLAARVAVSFPEAATYFGRKAVVTGYPVRADLLAADKASSRAALGLRPEGPVLLVFGGSRGAHSINAALAGALPRLLPRFQVVHVTGQHDWSWVDQITRERAGGLPWENYHPYAYLHAEMVQALAAADLVVARAGASTLGEFPAVGLAAILVPYPYAGQHQLANAEYLARPGAAVVVKDSELDARLAPEALSILETPGRLEAMSRAAYALARPEAARNIAAELIRLAGR